MSDKIKIVYRGGEGEIVEKKSRFIAYVKPVNSDSFTFLVVPMRLSSEG